MNHVHPKSNGIFNRLFSTAILCTSLIFSTDLILNSPPTLPSSIFLASELLAAPVVISPDVGKFNCPIFHPLSFLPLIQLQTPFLVLSVLLFLLLFLAIAKKRKA
jgi:hypothetical protein